VVGAALAVTKDSRLVYARGFGWTDRDRREAVRPDSLFRIASISKPLTATAIMQLVERRRLQLDAKIFRLLELPPTKDGRWQDVTVEHLLHHTGGWDREKSFDPMFRSVVISKSLDLPPPATPQHIIRYMTQQPLDFDPGSRFVYSNFGYCLLGRVIERVSGMRYGQYVRQNVLRPLEIGRMQLGATLLDRRASQEVRYYDAKNRTGPSVFVPGGKPVPLPYGTWCLESMDAHGGWIASAVDLARFAAALDTPDECRILHRHGIDTMFARPDGPAGHESGGQPKPAYYACGWNVRAVRRSGLNTWHTGALDGTSTLLVRRHDGVNWAVLFNCREAPNGKELAGLIDPLVHTAADAVTDWPQVDYFES
jgi:CubicO group peptidase (beta-lactamase class C family)